MNTSTKIMETLKIDGVEISFMNGQFLFKFNKMTLISGPRSGTTIGIGIVSSEYSIGSINIKKVLFSKGGFFVTNNRIYYFKKPCEIELKNNQIIDGIPDKIFYYENGLGFIETVNINDDGDVISTKEADKKKENLLITNEPKKDTSKTFPEITKVNNEIHRNNIPLQSTSASITKRNGTKK